MLLINLLKWHPDPWTAYFCYRQRFVPAVYSIAIFNSISLPVSQPRFQICVNQNCLNIQIFFT